MTTFLDRSEGLTRCGDGIGGDSGNLLERFWAAVNFDSHTPSDDASKLDRSFDSTYEELEDRTPEIFAKTGSSPMVDISGVWGYTHPTALGLSTTHWSCTDPNPLSHEHKFKSYRSASNVESAIAAEASPPTSTVPKPPPAPIITARNTAFSIKSSNREDVQHHAHRAPSPTSPVLALVSSFLDSVVMPTHSRSSTPSTIIPVARAGDIEIVESEVFVNVIEDGIQAGLSSPLELLDDASPGRLEIPPVPLLSIVPAPGGNYDLQSPCMINGPAASAQELDALSWMSWERQLSNVHATFWH